MSESADNSRTNRNANVETVQLAWLMIGAGGLWSFYLLIRRVRNFLAWLIPLGLLIAGANILLDDRQKRITRTSEEIRAQLEDLDPIARAQVVKYLADQEMKKMSN